MGRRLTIAGIALAVCLAPAGIADAKKKRGGPPGLTPFASCKSLKRYALNHPRALPTIGFTGGEDDSAESLSGGPGKKAPLPASGGADSGASSGTNVQEPGIDEPDFVKSDGDLLYVVQGGRLTALESGPGAPRELGTIFLGRQARLSDSTLLVRGDRLLVLNDSGFEGELLIQQVDVANPAAMKVNGSMLVPGEYVDARQDEGVARVVVNAPLVGKAAEKRGKPRKLIPKVRIATSAGRSKRPVVPCSQASAPRTFSGLELMTVLTIDLDQGLPAVDSDAVLMDGDTVYSSAEGLFVATERFSPRFQRGPTEIHRFSLDGSTTSYQASGRVPGYMLSQFSMSEHEGVLRVASTSARFGGPRERGESFVTTLVQSGGDLVQAGQVRGLGRSELIYAVRFLGDVGYVVTFREVDPLYTLDLANPATPIVTGELKVRGYSAYLHPLPGGRLLGVGQDATSDGVLKGTQVSLFDVANLAAPSLLSRAALGGYSSSEAEIDHKAFLFWEPKSLAVIPAHIEAVRTGRPLFDGAIAFTTAGGVQEAARIDHGPGSPPIRRAIVNSGRLVTVSERGVLVSDLDSFGDLGWVPFPRPRN